MSYAVEDGILAGMFPVEAVLQGSELWRRATSEVEARHPGFLGTSDDRKLRVKRVANQLIGTTIRDLVDATRARLREAAPKSPADVRAHPRMLVAHGPEIGPHVAELQAFLYARFYRHPHLLELSEYARKVLARLFDAYRTDPTQMSPWYQSWARQVGLERAVCDYLAGMTDRFAEQEFARFGPV
jgi:dGTPase